jgi:GTPase SAR1 family protein
VQQRERGVNGECTKKFAGQQNDGTPREVMTEEEKAKDRLKLVFFGPSGSGKSTLYKQCIFSC